MRSAYLLPLTLLVAASAACKDPALDDRIAALGNETSGIPKGEFHRAGQPCTYCHVEGGPAGDKPFTIAGTVFAQPNRLVGVSGVEVTLLDSDHTSPPTTVKTNCVGNFFIEPGGANGWQPKFPVSVGIAKGVARKMLTIIGRASSCGECHSADVTPADPLSQVPHIYIFNTDEAGKPNGDPDCAVDPRAPGDPGAAPGTP